MIVGGGPVGLVTSIMLGRLGVKHALFERHPGTSIHPKQIGLNQRTMEIFRGLGVAADVRAEGAPPFTHERTAWHTSLAGPTELHGRRIAIRDAWGGGRYREEYSRASAAWWTMLAQIRLEPILRRHAEASPLAHLAFGAEVAGISPRGDHVDVQVEEDSGTARAVRARYLIGADGGRTVAGELGIGHTGPSDLVDMVSAHFSADLSPYLEDDSSLIYWFVNPDFAGSIGSGAIYHCGPWDERGVSKEWNFLCTFRPDDPERFDEEGMRQRIVRSLGLPELEPEVLSISHWHIRAVVADAFRGGRCFLAGDAPTRSRRGAPWASTAASRTPTT